MFVDVAYLQLMKCTIQNSPAHRYGGTLSDREECIEEFNPPEFSRVGGCSGVKTECLLAG